MGAGLLLELDSGTAELGLTPALTHSPQLERAVDRAAELGVYVQVFGGGSMDPPRHNSLKLGPLELTLGGKKLDRRELELVGVRERCVDQPAPNSLSTPLDST